MGVIVWDAPADRWYESGLSKGVLYYPLGNGIAWNGLVSIIEKEDVSRESLYYDGVKFSDSVSIGEFSATLSAYTYPDSFDEVQGIATTDEGLVLYNQPKKRFHLSYQTKTETTLSSDYRIHILYNLIAIPSDRSHNTLSDGSEPTLFEWELSSIPMDIPGYRPTEHIVLDSRTLNPLMMERLEAVLYGTSTTGPFLPDPVFFTEMTSSWYTTLTSAQVVALALPYIVK